MSKFEVGKSYQRRDGKMVKIISAFNIFVLGDDFTAKFETCQSTDGWRWADTGRIHSCSESPFDLIENGPLKIR
jgi:hypothetical protein